MVGVAFICCTFVAKIKCYAILLKIFVDPSFGKCKIFFSKSAKFESRKKSEKRLLSASATVEAILTN